jgi:hypothetical protein
MPILSTACAKAWLSWLTSLRHLITLNFKFKMRLRLPSAFEMHARPRGWLAGWLHGEMLLHHTPQLQKS